MRYEDSSALLQSKDSVEVCQPLPPCLIPVTPSPLPETPIRREPVQPVRQDGVAAGLVALECCRNGMPTGAVVRSIATAFGLPAAIVAMHLGRARRLSRKVVAA